MERDCVTKVELCYKLLQASTSSDCLSWPPVLVAQLHIRYTLHSLQILERSDIGLERSDGQTGTHQAHPAFMGTTDVASAAVMSICRASNATLKPAKAEVLMMRSLVLWLVEGASQDSGLVPAAWICTWVQQVWDESAQIWGRAASGCAVFLNMGGLRLVRYGNM